MCYPKPGPRCSAHAAEQVTRTKTRMLKNSTVETVQAHNEALAEYDATPAGMKELERRIKQYVSGSTYDKYVMRLQLGKAKREESLFAVKKLGKKKVKHKMNSVVFPKSFHTLAENHSQLKKIKIDDPVIDEIIKDSKQWVSRLNDNEIEAASWYTSNGSIEINRYLAGDFDEYFGIDFDEYDEKKKLYDETLTHLDSALNKSVRKKPVRLYRGVPPQILEKQGYEYNDKEKYIADNFVVGEKFSSKFFMSSSLDYRKAKGFSSSSKIVMEILAKKAGPVSNVSAWGVVEKEYILPRNQEYRVIGVKETNKVEGDPSGTVFVVQLEEI